MLTQEQKQKIVEMFTQGQPKAHIAKELGISKPIIYKVIREFQFGDKPKKEEKYFNIFSLSPDQSKRLSILSELYGIDESGLIEFVLNSLRKLYDTKLVTSIEDFVSVIENGIELSALVKENNSVPDVLERLQEIQDEGIDLSELKRAVDTVHQLRSFDNVVEQINSQIQEKEKEKFALGVNVNRLNKNIEALNQDVQRLVAAVADKENQLQKAVEGYQKLKANEKELMINLGNLAVERRKGEIDDLDKQIKEKQQEVYFLFEAVNQLKQELKELKEKHSIHITFWENLSKGDPKAIRKYLEICADFFKSGDLREQILTMSIKNYFDSLK